MNEAHLKEEEMLWLQISNAEEMERLRQYYETKLKEMGDELAALEQEGDANIYPDNAAVQEIVEQINPSVGCSSSTSSQDSAAKVKEEAEIDFVSKESQVLEHRSTEPIPAERDNISDEEIDDLLKSDDEDDLTQSSTSIKVRQTSSIQAPPLPLLSEQLMSLIKTKEAPPSSHSKRSSSLRRSPNKSPSLKRSASLGRNHPK